MLWKDWIEEAITRARGLSLGQNGFRPSISIVVAIDVCHEECGRNAQMIQQTQASCLTRYPGCTEWLHQRSIA